MRNRTKGILSALIVVALLFCGFIYLLGHLMAIEDHYGDLQQFYYQSKEGDLILNHDNKKFGIIKKNSERIHVVDDKKAEVDLYNWVYIYDDFKESKIEVYRLEEPLNISKIDYEEVVRQVHENESELIIKN